MQKVFGNKVSGRSVGVLGINSSKNYSPTFSEMKRLGETNKVPMKFVFSVLYFVTLCISLILLFS